MARSFPLGPAALFGWIALVGVVGGLIVIPTAIAGQPPTMATPLPEALDYFRHTELVGLGAVISVFLAGLPILPFGLGLRTLFGSADDPRAGRLADIGMAILIVTLPIYVVCGALGAALATAAAGDATTFPALHAFYQLLYNGSADVLEGAWIGAFSLAALLAPMPRLVGWLGLVLAASRWIKAFVPVAAIPGAIIPISGILFVAWFLAVVVLLTMRARGATAAARPAMAAG